MEFDHLARRGWPLGCVHPDRQGARVDFPRDQSLGNRAHRTGPWRIWGWPVITRSMASSASAWAERAFGVPVALMVTDLPFKVATKSPPGWRSRLPSRGRPSESVSKEAVIR